MSYRHPKRHARAVIPTQWLMTDERLGNDLWPAIEALPRGAGIVFRHHATEPAARRVLFRKVERIARRKRLVLVRAGPDVLGRGEKGVQGSTRLLRPGVRIWSAHSRTEAIAGKRAGATMLFVSPVHPTRSHPGARSLGPLRAAAIGQGLGLALIALGGMSAARSRRLKNIGFHGWAAIDAWRPTQKRKAVPI